MPVRSGGADIPEAATYAPGLAAAGIFTQAHQQGVVFIKEVRIGGEIIREQGLIGSVAGVVRLEADAINDMAGVGVNDEGRLAGGVEDDGIGCFLADAVDGEELLAEVAGFVAEKLVQVILVVLSQPVDQGLELECLGVVVAGGVDEGGNFVLAETT